MQLKRYQERVLKEVGQFLTILAREQHQGTRHAALDAWEQSKEAGLLLGSYQARKNGLKKDLPTFGIKVPTGGGKTLLAIHVLGLIYDTVHKARNGAGLVLWVVPSDQIYKDTLRSLRSREHPYRQSLEGVVNPHVEIWEKEELNRLNKDQLTKALNIVVLKLASTNREVREQLKFFQDSGGNIVQHFPPEDDPQAHGELFKRIPNLDMLAADVHTGEFLAATSLANLVRVHEPVVILDEGHKATSTLARQTIETLNPSLVVELSATPPKDANTLVRVTGQELYDEHMIKLPVNVCNSNQRNWQDCITQARDKRLSLAQDAETHFDQTSRQIRPIVLVQVERTGKDQRDAGQVHSEDVRDFLMQKLGIPENAIAIKTSEKDQLEDTDLLAEGCPIEWIITKSALQEGWDCPFAYVLVSLSNTKSAVSMTQLVGRILRQPDQERSAVPSLNESYVFCLRRKAAEVIKEVKKALEKEGYEGSAAAVVDSSQSSVPSVPQAVKMRPALLQHYRPFEGKVYLPRFAIRNGESYEALDYFSHLLSSVNVEHFDYAGIEWDLDFARQVSKDAQYRIGLGTKLDASEMAGQAAESLEDVQRWIAATLQVDYLSFREINRIVARALQSLLKKHPEVEPDVAVLKFHVKEKIRGLLQRAIDMQTQAKFESLYRAGKVCFYLECKEARFEIPPEIKVKRDLPPLRRSDHSDVQRSLFDYVPDSLNDYERAVALYLDHHPEVLWWYRNLVGHDNFSIQGYRRNRVYPDFVVQQGHSGVPIASVVVVESKGKHLKGSEDTAYKRSIADYFERVGKAVPWQKLAEDFDNNQFRFHILDEGEYEDRDWRTDLQRLLELDTP